jgi:serine/threonine-protein kinase HipA
VSVTIAEVKMWGSRVGAVRWDPDRGLADYEYDPVFLASGIQLAPLRMPLGPGVWSFPELSRTTFKGLPGMLADSLPDKFGTALIDAWLVRQGRSVDGFTPVERLCYVGNRGMGALEFAPAMDTGEFSNSPLDIAQLVDLAQRAIAPKAHLAFDAADPQGADLSEIIRVGTSAGGARAKAVIAWNEATGEIRSGQLDQPATFTDWLLKFDGVDGNRDKELADPLGYGRIEHAYAQMARAAGITVPRTQLLEEGGRAHFMTERFDRSEHGRLHLQSLTALAHFDFNLAGVHSYEQALDTMRRLRLSNADLVEQFRRAVFNVVARNQDDHTKNISFLMDRSGEWRLSPAYDITYSYNPEGAWTSSHQMTINGKRDGFERADIAEFALAADLSQREGLRLLDDVCEVVDDWPAFASDAGIDPAMSAEVERNLRTAILA